MTPEQSSRRLTLRQLLTVAEKSSRDLIEQLQISVLGQISDFRDLSRPVRRRSHYPTMVSLQNAMKKMLNAHHDAETIANTLRQHMETIRDHAKRERVNKL